MQVVSHLKSFNTSPPTLDTANRYTIDNDFGGGIVSIIVYQSCTLIWSEILGLQEVLDVISWGVHSGMLRVTYVNIVQFTPRRYTLHEQSVVIVSLFAGRLGYS